MALTKVSRGLLNTSIVDNGNATAITIDSSENVGIGTSAPSAPLNISATYASDTTEQFRIQDNTGGKLDFFGYGNGGKGIQAYADDGSTFYNLNLNPLGGNVGIGISNPDSVLEVNVTTSGSGANNNTAGSSIGIGTSGTTQPILGMRWTGASHVGISGNAFSTQIVNDTANSNAFEMYTTGATPLVFGTAATERMRIDGASGTVKISHADTASEGLRVIQTTAGRTSGGALGLFYDDQGGTTQPTLVVQQNGTGDILQLFDGGSQVVTVKDGGNLLVGSSSSPQISAGSVARIQVISESSGATAFAPSLPASATGTSIRSQSVTAAGTGWNHFVGSSGNGSSLTANNIFIYGNGDIGNTNNSYGAISDAKLKENITDATPKLAGINAVRVVNYNLIDHPELKQLGVIAQELEQIFPGMVSEAPDRDMEGNDLGTVTKSVKYSVFVPMLIKGMQEQQAIIEALTARLEALEGA